MMLKKDAQVFADYLSGTFGIIARLRYKGDAEQQTQAKWCINVYASEEDAENDAEPTAIIGSPALLERKTGRRFTTILLSEPSLAGYSLARSVLSVAPPSLHY